MPISPSQIPAKLLVARLLWFAFFGASVFYVVVAFILHRNGQRPTMDDADLHRLLRTALGGVSVILFLIQLLVIPRIVSAKTTGERLETERAQAAMVALLIRSAMVEAMAIFGLVLFILFGSLIDSVAFSAVAAVALLGIFPTSSMFEPPPSGDTRWDHVRH